MYLPTGYGYPYKTTDKWIINYMLHNLLATPDEVSITYDIDFIPATSPAAATITPARPAWMDVQNGETYPVFDVIRGEGSNGRFVYQANRATRFAESQGARVWSGGTNAIAVYAINQSTGEPTLIQNADSHSIVPRTFAFDPSAKVMVAANQTRMSVRDGQALTTVMPNLALFQVRADGKLDFVRKYDVAAELAAQRNDGLFWMGVVPLP